MILSRFQASLANSANFSRSDKKKLQFSEENEEIINLITFSVHMFVFRVSVG
jgi:hypothetical protein